MEKFKHEFGIIENVSDHDYFTNSIHVPVWQKVDAFTKIDIESKLTGYSSAGCITYVELDGSVKNNPKAVEEVVNRMMDMDIPYGAINVPVDLCNDCGYEEEISTDECPVCGGTNITRLRRVTGYLSGDYQSSFNYAKQKEVENRVKHTGVSVVDNCINNHTEA
jgi:ribonucleoside-triphosphate reductase